MREIHNMITAVTAAYADFAAAGPDRETRDAVGNAVRFLVADLNSINQLAAREGAQQCRLV
ncbi:hypothetical protein [Amycolatopsis cihanbeyliensis]|uniref:Uncharacterized protein n=1 Tax=Amycolatopsis cihanbeyliensis TaxID=1128664 RepID=A0A542DQS4_AMYCI|nr:hypothetical protein [Amycolatopsis cihanbeyliensis]TQJ05452.1 hypothetical protein FB471_5283 [Amycolatopsis cihanbeyliensis]